MYDKERLCDRIVKMYPEIGKCKIDVKVDWDDEKKAWVVDMKKDTHELRHFLEEPDAGHCMEDKECVSLGLEIAQLVKNIKGEQY